MKSKRLSITAIVLTKNESATIANCLETLRWCDEIIVVDNDSTDGTDSIAERLGAQVITFKSQDFSQKREAGLKRAKTDWVIYVDADERITPRLYQEIAVHLETEDAQVLRMRRENVHYGFEMKHGGWENDYVTRIFKRSILKGWSGEIHESPEFEGNVITLHTPLLHLTHRSTQDNLIKSANWTIMEAQLLNEAGQSPVTLFTLVRKGLGEFIRRAILQGGYKDGMPGLIEAVTQALNRVIVYIQVWELQQKPSITDRYQEKEIELVNMWKHHS